LAEEENVHANFIELSRLKAMQGYRVLENEWLHQVTKIEAARSRAAKRGQESAWRYWAGYEEGFKLAMMTLHRALERMEVEVGEMPGNSVDKLLEEIRK
jgi:hypothetical protein